MATENVSASTDESSDVPCFKLPEQLVLDESAWVSEGGLTFGLSQRGLASCTRTELISLGGYRGEAQRMVANVATVARTIGGLVEPDAALDENEDFERVDGFTSRRELSALLQLLADASDHADQLLRVASSADCLRRLRDEVAMMEMTPVADHQLMVQRNRASDHYRRTGVLPPWAPGQPGAER